MVTASISAFPMATMAAPPLAAPSSEATAQALRCLTDTIAYEAGLEPLAGQQAVAEVVINRTRSPHFPKTICGVVYQGAERHTGCQFTFTCDGSLRRRLPDRMLATARSVAAAALAGQLPDQVAGATFYHAYYVTPRWARFMTRVNRISAHIFYRTDGGPPLDPAPPIPPGPGKATGDGGQAFSPWGLAITPPQGRQIVLN